MTAQALAFAMVSISLSACAQLLMKMGMMNVPTSGSSGTELIFKVSTNPLILGGFLTYGIGAVLWLKVLSQTELSMAYPFVSLGFVLVAILSWLVLGEHLSVGRVVGIALVVAGVVIVGKT